MAEERRFWGIEDAERLTATTPDEAIEEYLDQGPPLDEIDDTDEVVVHEFAPMKVSLNLDYHLERILEDLDEEFGNPDGDYTEPTPGMLAAAQVFANAILAEYTSWACEQTGEAVRVNTLAWIREHRPEWLKGTRHD